VLLTELMLTQTEGAINGIYARMVEGGVVETTFFQPGADFDNSSDFAMPTFQHGGVTGPRELS